jgi:multidrug transporter EmrE-like cation transporter
MKSADLALILTGVMLNAAAQLLLKVGSRAISGLAFNLANGWTLAERIALNPPILAGLACYVISVVFWILALSRVDVSIAYPMLSVGHGRLAAVFGSRQRDACGRHFHHHCRRVAGCAQLKLRRIVTVSS